MCVRVYVCPGGAGGSLEVAEGEEEGGRESVGRPSQCLVSRKASPSQGAIPCYDRRSRRDTGQEADRQERNERQNRYREYKTIAFMVKTYMAHHEKE
jgi:hypothetical protein